MSLATTFNDILSQRKWRALVLYQYALPIAIILGLAVSLGLNNRSIATSLLQVAFDGELSLVAVFLILGTAVELSGNNHKSAKGAKPQLGKLIVEAWVVYVITAMIIYSNNKAEVLHCGTCIQSMNLDLTTHIYIWFNIANVFISPMYCFACILYKYY